MIQLQRHIEILLLENECVIVPDFGGFMTHQVAAHYDEADRSFVPPTRTLGFNPQLRMNDSVLAQSYVEAYDISYPEALRRIEHEVDILKQKLNDEGYFEMENLGTLTVNQEGNYEFSPCEAGVLSPDLYGLSNFTFKRLKDTDDVIAEQPAPVAKEVSLHPTLLEFTDSDNHEEEDSALTIKLSWIRNAVAVAAAVVAFFLISTPITNSNLNTQAMSHMQHKLLYKLIPQDTNIVPAEPVETVLPAASEAELEHESVMGAGEVEEAEATAKVEETQEAKTPEKVQQNTYYIVVASQVRMKNAELYVAKLKKEGYNDARILLHNKVVRVVCGEFTSQAEAYQKLHKMSFKEEFYEAWVYKVPAEV